MVWSRFICFPWKRSAELWRLNTRQHPFQQIVHRSDRPTTGQISSTAKKDLFVHGMAELLVDAELVDVRYITAQAARGQAVKGQVACLLDLGCSLQHGLDEKMESDPDFS